MALTNILKKFMTRNFAMQCNMQRGNNKHIVGETSFVKTIVDFLTNYYNRDVKEGDEPKITSKMVSSSFGIVFTNSKDWDGHRAKRSSDKALKMLQHDHVA